MKVTTINTGSTGNGYVIEVDGEYLLIECGVKAKEMLKTVKFQTSLILGCLLSHFHLDHAQYIREYQKYGFPIIASHEVANDMQEYVWAIPRMKKKKISDRFSVIPFSVPHNETECDGFFIEIAGEGNLLFITDAEMCPYDFSKSKINHVMVECNYLEDYLDIESVNKTHVLKGHMELQTCKRFLKSLNSEELRTIGLLHMSRDNADPERFLSEIQEEFPDKKVWIAKKGFTLEV